MIIKAIGQITIADMADTMVTQSTAPATPEADMLWLDTSVQPNQLKRWDGSEWVGAGGSSELDDVAGRVQTAEQKITPEAITQSVEDYIAGHSTTISTITQTSNAINLAVGNVKIGGRNLLPNTDFTNDFLNWSWWSSSATHTKMIVDETISPTGKAIQYTWTAAGLSGAYYSGTKTDNMIVGEQYTVSCWLKSSTTASILFSHEGGRGSISKAVTANTWTRFSYTFTDSGAANTAIVFYYQVSQPIGTLLTIHSLKLEKGNKDTDWSPSTADPVTSLKNSSVTITSDEVSINTPQFTLEITDPSNPDNVKLRMSAEGDAGFDILKVKRLECDTVASAQLGSTITTANIQTTINSLGKYLKGDVIVKLSANYNGYISVKGFTGAGLTIDLNGKTFTGSATFAACTHVTLTNGTIIDNQAVGSNATVTVLDSTELYASALKIDSNDKSKYSISVGATSKGYFHNVDSIRASATCFMAETGSVIQAYLCRGTSLFGVHAETASIITLGQYMPTGTVAHQRATNGGQVLGKGTPMASTMASGGGVSTPTTKEYVATKLDSYRYAASGISEKWRNDDVIRQGEFNGYGVHTGCFWPDAATLRADIGTKTVQSATLTIVRASGTGSNSAKAIYLWGLNNTTNTGTVSRNTSYGSLGTWAWGENKTVSIPTAAVTAYKAGTINGFCFYNASDPYMTFTEPPILTVTYQ